MQPRQGQKHLTMKFLAMLPVFLYFLLPLFLSSVSTFSGGLTLKLIPPSSPESPFYMGTLSFGEKNHRCFQQSKARVQYLTSRALANKSKNGSQLSGISPPVNVQPGMYSVKVGIGNFANESAIFKSYFLVMDTASDTMWLQCAGCRNCFPQEGEPPFPQGDSTTFGVVGCSDSPISCGFHQCDGQVCRYDFTYLDGSHSRGLIAREVFTFDTHHGKPEKRDLIFGCGLDQEGGSFDRPGNKLAGILGLSWGPDALHLQLQAETGAMFSYCLPSENTPQPHETYLSFGVDIQQTSDFQATQLIRDRYGQYRVNLEGISLNHQRLVVGAPLELEEMAAIVDSGSCSSYLYTPFYDMLEEEMVKLFSADPNLRRIQGQYSLCYERIKPEQEMYSHLPTLTLNFQGADYDIGPEGVFLVDVDYTGNQYFCMMIDADPNDSYIGANFQINHRFIFDLMGQQLLFKPEEC